MILCKFSVTLTNFLRKIFSLKLTKEKHETTKSLLCSVNTPYRSECHTCKLQGIHFIEIEFRGYAKRKYLFHRPQNSFGKTN